MSNQNYLGGNHAAPIIPYGCILKSSNPNTTYCIYCNREVFFFVVTEVSTGKDRNCIANASDGTYHNPKKLHNGQATSPRASDNPSGTMKAILEDLEALQGGMAKLSDDIKQLLTNPQT